eukprot:Lithocolla_globosa_v1_NODE_8099_length_861_cov_126.538462.p2 type:complete len:109 gc:universal NODE_8099_length_861_cov_126.538462:509-835(+)
MGIYFTSILAFFFFLVVVIGVPFVELCVEAFLIIRRNSTLFINLLRMMICSDLPELKSETDIDYVRSALFLGESEVDAKNSFEDLIAECIKSDWSTHLNWYIHNLAHR